MQWNPTLHTPLRNGYLDYAEIYQIPDEWATSSNVNFPWNADTLVIYIVDIL